MSFDLIVGETLLLLKNKVRYISINCTIRTSIFMMEIIMIIATILKENNNKPVKDKGTI